MADNRTATCKNTDRAIDVSANRNGHRGARTRDRVQHSSDRAVKTRSRYARRAWHLGRIHALGVSASLQPRSEGLRFDLARRCARSSVLRAEIPEDAFTASILGTERFGNGVVIRDERPHAHDRVSITEAESIWLTTNDGTVIPGHPLAYDFASGLGTRAAA